MNFSQKFLLYFMTLSAFVSIDLLLVFVFSRRLYRINLGGLLRAKLNIIPAVIFYIMFTLGLLTFVIVPAFNSDSLRQAIGMGALFGLFAYGTYSLINRAMIRNWTRIIMLTDIFRGVIVSGAACAIAFYISRGF